MEVFTVKTSKRVFRNTWRARLHSMPIVDRRRPPWAASLTTKTQHNKCTRCLCALPIVVEHIYACNDTDTFCHSTRSRPDLFIVFLQNEMSPYNSAVINGSILVEALNDLFERRVYVPIPFIFLKKTRF
jgi:hypothetical protein